MNKKILALSAFICLLILLLCYKGVPAKEYALSIVYNDDAAGLIMRYTAESETLNLQAVNMDYRQLRDCCGSQADILLSSNAYDMAILCPDAAGRLIAAGRPYVNGGAIIFNANVLTVLREKMGAPFVSIGYMNVRESQVATLRAMFGEKPLLKPVIPSALPYALERKAVDAAVMDITAALRLDAEYMPLKDDNPASVLVVHEKFYQSPLYDRFVEEYNAAVKRLRDPKTLQNLLESYYQKENCEEEVFIWQKMKISWQPLPRRNPDTTDYSNTF
jgi:hypothetical protein